MLTPIEKSKITAEALQTLGVRQFATPTEVRAAWRSLAMKMHADPAEGSSAEFALAKSAYEFLSNAGDGACLSTEQRPEPFYAKQNRQHVGSRRPALSPDAEFACKTVLGQQESGAQGDVVQKIAALVQNCAKPAAQQSAERHHHVPGQNRRWGGQMSYKGQFAA